MTSSQVIAKTELVQFETADNGVGFALELKSTNQRCNDIDIAIDENDVVVEFQLWENDVEVAITESVRNEILTHLRSEIILFESEIA